MADAWVAALHALIAGICSVPALSLGARAFRDKSDADAVSSATAVDIGQGSSLIANEGQWLAVRGDVFSPSPIRALNGVDAAVVETQLETRRYGSNEPAWQGGRTILLSRSWKEAPWYVSGRPKPTAPPADSLSQQQLSGPASGNLSVGAAVASHAGAVPVAMPGPGTFLIDGRSVVEIERDAVRRAAEADSRAVSGLQPAGMMLDPSATARDSWLGVGYKVLQLMLGYYDDGPWRVENAIPVGVAVTVVGRIDSRGGSLFLGPHPSLGFFVSRDGVSATVASYRFSYRMNAVLAGIFGSVAVYHAAKAMAIRYPWARSALTWLSDRLRVPVLHWPMLRRARPGHWATAQMSRRQHQSSSAWSA